MQNRCKMERKSNSIQPGTCLILLILCITESYGAARSPCPPAELGETYDVWCPAPDNQNVQWEVRSPSGQVQRLDCDRKNYVGCRTPVPQEMSVSYVVNKGGYQSRLRINRVTTDQNNNTITCLTDESAGAILASCKLHVLLKPELPQCKTFHASGNKIRFQCHTGRVFPGLACRVTQRDTQRNEDVHLYKGFRYQRSSLNPHDHGAACYTDIRELRPGTYQFVGSLSPADGRGRFMKGFSVQAPPTSPITISASQAYVRVSSPDTWPVRICPGVNTSVTLKCQSYGFKPRPHIEWFVNQRKVGDQESSVHEIYVNSSNVISTYEFPSRRKLYGADIACRATTPEQESSDSKRFTALWPPDHVPQFRDRRHHEVKLSVALSEGETKQMMCVVKGGQPQVLNVQVLCYRDAERLVFSASKGSVTSFILNGTPNFDRGICTCSAGHETNCYYSTTIITITVTPAAVSQTGASGSHSYLVLYLTLIVICLIALATITVFGTRQLCKKRGSCRFTLQRRSSGARLSTINDPRHIYETIDSGTDLSARIPPSGFSWQSSLRCDCAETPDEGSEMREIDQSNTSECPKDNSEYEIPVETKTGDAKWPLLPPTYPDDQGENYDISVYNDSTIGNNTDFNARPRSYFSRSCSDTDVSYRVSTDAISGNMIGDQSFPSSMTSIIPEIGSDETLKLSEFDCNTETCRAKNSQVEPS